MATVVPLPFLISSILLSVVLVVLRLQFPAMYLPMSLFATIGLLEVCALWYWLAEIAKAYSSGSQIIVSIVILALYYSANVATLLARQFSLRRDPAYLQWSERNRCVSLTIYSLSTGLSFRISRAEFSRLGDLDEFSAKLKSNESYYHLNLVSVVSIFMITVVTLICSGTVANRQPNQNQVFFCSLDVLFIEIVVLLVSIAEFLRPKAYLLDPSQQYRDGEAKNQIANEQSHQVLVGGASQNELQSDKSVCDGNAAQDEVQEVACDHEEHQIGGENEPGTILFDADSGAVQSAAFPPARRVASAAGKNLEKDPTNNVFAPVAGKSLQTNIVKVMPQTQDEGVQFEPMQQQVIPDIGQQQIQKLKEKKQKYKAKIRQEMELLKKELEFQISLEEQRRKQKQEQIALEEQRKAAAIEQRRIQLEQQKIQLELQKIRREEIRLQKIQEEKRKAEQLRQIQEQQRIARELKQQQEREQERLRKEELKRIAQIKRQEEIERLRREHEAEEQRKRIELEKYRQLKEQEARRQAIIMEILRQREEEKALQARLKQLQEQERQAARDLILREQKERQLMEIQDHLSREREFMDRLERDCRSVSQMEHTRRQQQILKLSQMKRQLLGMLQGTAKPTASKSRKSIKAETSIQWTKQVLAHKQSSVGDLTNRSSKSLKPRSSSAHSQHTTDNKEQIVFDAEDQMTQTVELETNPGRASPTKSLKTIHEEEQRLREKEEEEARYNLPFISKLLNEAQQRANDYITRIKGNVNASRSENTARQYEDSIDTRLSDGSQSYYNPRLMPNSRQIHSTRSFQKHQPIQEEDNTSSIDNDLGEQSIDATAYLKTSVERSKAMSMMTTRRKLRLDPKLENIKQQILSPPKMTPAKVKK